MYLEYEDVKDPIQYCIDTILKEARKEDRLVKQLFYAMASAYSNNPLNLAINSPTGEGKNWVIKKVSEKFPQEDVLRLSGMTTKAVFHRRGSYVIKNEQTGRYEPIDTMLEDIDFQIEEKLEEIERTKDKNTKKGLRAYIKSLEKDKTELRARSKKLIELSHKILIFLDTPPQELLSALMALLSHDEYETEYEYVDTHNGVVTKSNVLRGWPAVIFAQAIDYSYYKRFPEIQRRFLNSNPRMDTEKYEAAIELSADIFGIPDFMYQAKILENQDYEKCRELVLQIKEKMLELSDKVKQGKNQRVLFHTFADAIKSSLPKTKALDMTTGNRLFTFLSLLPIINIDRRPRLVTTQVTKTKTETGDEKEKERPVEITPIALFEDLAEAMFLMENSSGLRPYQIEWYEKVFLGAFDAKTTVDFKTVKNQVVTENIIAVTTEQLAQKTKEVYQRVITSKRVLDTYLEPLLNEGYIDKTGSDIDHRFNIYFPLVATKTFDYSSNSQSNNILHRTKVVVEDYTLFPDKQHIISKIEEVLRYSIQKGLRTVIKTHDWKDITPEELVDRYYSRPEDYFDLTQNPFTDNNNNSDLNNHYYSYLILKNNVFRNPFQIEYFQNDEIASESQGKNDNNIESTSPQSKTDEILFDEPLIEQSNTSMGPYEDLIETEYLQSLGKTAFRCKEHPDKWDTDLKGLEISHFEPFHEL